MMGSQELHSSMPSLSGPFPFHPLSIGAERWQVGEKTTKQILSVIQPISDSEKKRREIIKYLQTLVENSFGIKVFPFGSVPLKTYLPHGDIDLTVVSRYDTSQDLLSDIHNLLQREMMNNSKVQVKDVLYVPAQVKVVKCTVSDIAVDISFNQTAGISALCFLEQVDQLIGKDHLFKRSVTLIKAWCYYESRLLGGYYGLMSTYALEALVLHVINHFHSSLRCPLAVLYKFLEYYSMFDWERYCVAINGLVSLSSLPEISVHPPLDSDEMLVTDNFLRGFRKTFLSSTRAFCGTKQPVFPVKFLNIMDPLRDDNNLGRCVSKGSFFRIRSAFNYGLEKMTEIFVLPPGNITKELEFFFVNTLERNGRGSRADVVVPVPEYSNGGSITPSANKNNEDLLTGIEYDLWFDDYGIVSPIQLNTLSDLQVRGNQWVELSHKMQFDQSIYYDIDEFSRSSNTTLKNFQPTKEMSRGTGPYFPHLRQAGFQSGFGGNGGRGIQSQNRRNAAIQLVVKTWCTRLGNPSRCFHFGTKRSHCETLGDDHLPKGNEGLEGSREEDEEAKEKENEMDSKTEEEAKEEESGMNSKTVESEAIITPTEEESSFVGGYKCDVNNYTLEDFPVLPGSHLIPTPIDYSQSESPKSEKFDDHDTFSVEAVKNENFNCLSPRSVTSSEFGRQLEDDVSAVRDSLNYLAGDKKESSEEQLVIVVKPLELKDAKEFPPLRSVRPPESQIRFNKKEFPPLGKNVKPGKKMSKEVKRSFA